MDIAELIRRITVPVGYVLDSMTNGPGLPSGWDGDAWLAPDGGRGYFLRAWNNQTGMIAISQNEQSFETARAALVARVQGGGQWHLTVSERE